MSCWTRRWLTHDTRYLCCDCGSMLFMASVYSKDFVQAIRESDEGWEVWEEQTEEGQHNDGVGRTAVDEYNLRIQCWQSAFFLSVLFNILAQHRILALWMIWGNTLPGAGTRRLLVKGTLMAHAFTLQMPFGRRMSLSASFASLVESMLLQAEWKPQWPWEALPETWRVSWEGWTKPWIAWISNEWVIGYLQRLSSAYGSDSRTSLRSRL